VRGGAFGDNPCCSVLLLLLLLLLLWYRLTDRYVEWLLEKSINKAFKAFHSGFLTVVNGPALKLFNPEDLELVVCGTPELDFEALRKVTVYDGGFDSQSPPIQWFWEVVEAWPLEKRAKLLLFATGCAKAPIGGLGALKFKIQVRVALPAIHIERFITVLGA